MFTRYRFVLLETVVGTISMKPPEALSALPLELWDLLAALFLEYRCVLFSNLYYYPAPTQALLFAHASAKHLSANSARACA